MLKIRNLIHAFALSLFFVLSAQVAVASQEAAAVDSTQLQKIDIKVGNGEEAVIGKTVNVHYSGWVYDEQAPDKKGRKFDSSYDRKEHFSFLLGAGRVIKGWDKGVLGMKVGGQRTLIIPPSMAYGERGAGNVIPPNATLLFEVELMGLKETGGHY